MSKLAGQVALISGGASGLGAALVERFILEGAQVAVLDRSQAGCVALEKRYGEAVVCSRGDVREYADNERAVQACLDAFGRLDCAIGNAGIWDYSTPLVDLPADKLAASFDELFQVNVLGYLLLAKAALKPLVDSQGTLLFTVSNAGFWSTGGGPLYTATKHAVVGLVKQLAYELAPGAIATSLKGPASLDMQDRKFPAEAIEAGAPRSVPIGRMPTPAEYAGAYVFFASRDDNVPATGVVLNHDGGFSARGLWSKPRGGDDLQTKLGL